MKKSTIHLDLSGASPANSTEKAPALDLSAAARTENYLWLAGDEGQSVLRLEKVADNRWGNAKSHPLSDYISLLHAEEEIDIEGIDFDGRYLWITGSHSYKRKNAKPESSDLAKQIRRLAKVKLEANRMLLMRVPCQPNKLGIWELHRTCSDPANASQQLTAAKLAHSNTTNDLLEALSEDVHLHPFLKIPGKDNGFDIEGLAAYPDRLFLGLRGPVLRGWAILLELRPIESADGLLRLAPLDETNQRYRKYFLDLNGMGVRDLSRQGQHLLILAGPTMDLDGSMAIYRWQNAKDHAKSPLISQNALEELITIPYRSTRHGVDKAEGMVLLEDGSLLLVFDSPSPERIQKNQFVKADCYPLPKEKPESKKEPKTPKP